jgi:hypothetical protein
MGPEQFDQIYDDSFAVLDRARVNNLPVPAPGHFGKWVFKWDTASTAEAEAYRKPYQAADDICFVINHQLESGLIPNRISVVNKNTSNGLGRATSRITQPPLIVGATLAVGKRLPTPEDRQDFYRQCFEPLKKYARFMLTDRIGEDGLIINLHGYEVGMDDTPPWGETMSANWQEESAVLQRLTKLGETIVNLGRRRLTDGRELPLEHRATDLNVLVNWFQSMRLAKAGYDLKRAFDDPKIVLLKDVGFNAIAVDAFASLQEMAEEIDDPAYQLGSQLKEKVQQHHLAVHRELWSDTDQAYYSKNARSGELIPIKTIASLFPMVARPPQERKRILLDDFMAKETFNASCVAVALNSPFCEPGAYWRGGEWPFAKLVVIHKGLALCDFLGVRQEMQEKDLLRPNVELKGEFDHPITKQALGVPGFGATAAKDIIFLQDLKQQ